MKLCMQVIRALLTSKEKPAADGRTEGRTLACPTTNTDRPSRTDPWHDDETDGWITLHPVPFSSLFFFILFCTKERVVFLLLIALFPS